MSNIFLLCVCARANGCKPETFFIASLQYAFMRYSIYNTMSNVEAGPLIQLT